jgi:dTDP-4-dehydrorhamnose 3,5-epimerase
MIFSITPIKGALIIDLEPHYDNRGFFARTFCLWELKAARIQMNIVQGNISYNKKKGTLRGLHYSIPPADQTKIVRCIHGAIYDVIVDLRTDSPTYLNNFGIELSAENRRALYVPEMVAHGFQTLNDDTEIYYEMGEYYMPELERGVRYNDPLLNIQWPLPVEVISEKDKQWPTINEQVKLII